MALPCVDDDRPEDRRGAIGHSRSVVVGTIQRLGLGGDRPTRRNQHSLLRRNGQAHPLMAI